jgi:hypothetical protein
MPDAYTEKRGLIHGNIFRMKAGPFCFFLAGFLSISLSQFLFPFLCPKLGREGNTINSNRQRNVTVHSTSFLLRKTKNSPLTQQIILN